MSKIASYLGKTDFQDKYFIGTVAFRNEELTLPNGSKIALGIDGGHWVLILQEKAGTPFRIFEFDWHEKKLFIDKKVGSQDDYKHFKKQVSYFFAEADINDLVTILPPTA